MKIPLQILILMGLMLSSWCGPVVASEVEARLAYCKLVFDKVEAFKAFDPSQTFDADLIQEKETQLLSLSEFFLKPEVVREISKQLSSRDDLTAADVVEFFDGPEVDKFISHLNQVETRLKRKLVIEPDDLWERRLNPYVFHPVLSRLTSDDMGDVHILLKEWVDISKRDFLGLGSTRKALCDIADTYSSYLPGRENFAPDDLSAAQALVEMGLLVAVEKIFVGIDVVLRFVSSESWRFESSFARTVEETNNFNVALLRLVFLAEITYPGTVQQTDESAITWIGSNLAHQDRRPYGARYAAAMVLAAVESADAMTRIVDAITEIEKGDLTKPELEVIRQRRGPLDRLQPILAEALAVYQEEGASDAEYAKIVAGIYYNRITRVDGSADVRTEEGKQFPLELFERGEYYRKIMKFLKSELAERERPQ